MPFSYMFYKIKTISLKSLIFNKSIDEDLLVLNEKIHSNLATENFNEFLSVYGLNPKSPSKLKNKFMLMLFIYGFIKLFIFLNLDPMQNYDLCFYLGDFTLLFHSLRKFLLVFLELLISFSIQTNYLFNYNSNMKWIEVFKCFDGNVVPKSIGIRDKKILKKVLVLTDTLMKSVLINNVSFSLMIIGFATYLMTNNLELVNIYEMITVSFWFPVVMFDIFCLGGTTFTATVCFQIIVYYCYVNFKFNNKSINILLNEFKIKLSKLKSNYKLATVIMKWRVKNLFLQQNHLLIKIMEYNQFWSSFYLSLILNYIPAHIIVTQQALFANYISFQLKIMFWICCWIGNIFIILSSLYICKLTNQIKIHRKQLIRIQFEPNLKLDINTKIKVRNSL